MKNNLKIKKGIYQHYKGKLYEVIGEGLHSEDLERYIIYKALYSSKEFGKNVIWIRSKKMFQERVVCEGKKVPRFKYLGQKPRSA